MTNSLIIENFDKNRNVFLSLESMTNSLLATLLSNEEVNIHSITSRTKDRVSLKGKVERPSKSYTQLSDITDIVGIRITTYFSDDVDKIASLITQEFSIDKENSIDKRKALEPDRFGYMSLHIVAEHNLDRLRLREYSKFKNLKFEIQIRSILQHAWAEIEHDIGYKTVTEVPDLLKRKFSRLAGLLELADEEFSEIKNSIQDYKVSLPKRISESPSDVSLDLNSLESFVTNNPRVVGLELKIKEVFGCPITKPNKTAISNSLEFLKRMNIHTISDLLAVYDSTEEYIIPFLTEWLMLDNASNLVEKESIGRGISLLYLTYINLAILDDDELSNYVLSSAPFHNIDDLISEIKDVSIHINITKL